MSESTEVDGAIAPAIWVLDEKGLGEKFLSWLSLCARSYPAASPIVFGAQSDPELVARALELAPIERWLSPNSSQAEWQDALKTSLALQQARAHRQHRLTEARKQNRSLEELKINLENLVVERTEFVKSSKQQAERVSHQIRDLVNFVGQLTDISSTEDLLQLIRRELKRFRQVISPLLASFDENQKPMVLSFRQGYLVRKLPERPWPQSIAMRLNHQADQIYLANLLGRPVGRVIAVPMKLPRQSHETSSVLFIEHTFGDDELDEFLDFCTQRVESINLALDRLVLAEQMRAAAHQWESTFDGIRDPIAIVDIDYRVVRSNRSFAQSAQPSCHQAFAQTNTVCQGCPVGQAALTGRPSQGQVRRQGRIYSVFSYPILSEGDLISTSLINHYVDVTESRKLYGRAIQNEKMAAMGSLAGNIAHELNNPITGIRSLAQILLRELPEGGTLRADMAEVESAAERCESIIQHLREFSQLEREPEKVVDLNEIVSKTLPLLKAAMRIHASTIELQLEPLFVRVEPQLLQQTIFNIINNACQAMPQAGEISITSFREEKFAVLSVRDTGVGIAPDLLEQIFEPFFTTKSEGQGTGLGLSLSRSIVEQFGGTILVSSELGRGSEFRVRLPIA